MYGRGRGRAGSFCQMPDSEGGHTEQGDLGNAVMFGNRAQRGTTETAEGISLSDPGCVMIAAE